MAQEDKRARNLDSNNKPKDQQSSAKKIVSVAIVVATILGGIAAGISIWQFSNQAAQTVSHSPSVSPATSSAFSPIHSEENLVSQLVPGYEYDRLQQIIGAFPDIKIPLPSGNTMYQFNRQWEYIDLLVNDGRVLSVGVVGRTKNFRPTLYDDGTSVTVNGPPIAQQVNYSSIAGANGECATSGISFFYEGFPIGSPLHDISVVLGWDDTPLAATVPTSVCSAFIAGNKCDEFDQTTSGLSLKYSNCLNGLGLLQGIGRLSPSVVVVTAPGQSIIPDMLNVAYSSSL